MTDNSTLPVALSGLPQELVLAQASDLARAGHYAQAERLLRAPADGGSMPATHLDLLARIHAQQGKLADADACWALAAEISQDADAYRPQRQRIATLRRQRFDVARGLRWAGSGLLAAAVLAAIVAPWLPGGPDHDPHSEVSAGSAQQDEIARRLADIDRRTQESGRLLSAISTESSSATTLIRPAPGSLTMSFTLPLFRGAGAVLTPEGAAALSELGRRLAPHAGQISTEVVGHTEDAVVSSGGRYQDNADLALGRALAAAQRLSAASGIPLQGFALSSAGRTDPPFPNSTSDDRARNRTVTLTIRPVAG